jgi:hypothetical protein
VFATDTTRDLVYATDTAAEQIDELQFTLGEGPCLAAYRSSVPELHPDMADPAATTRWPMFVPEILDLGIHGIFAFPLGLGDGARIGVLELYRRQPGPLAAEHYRAAVGYAAVLGPTVVEELDPSRNPSTVMDPALFPRGNVHVAAGMMAAQLRLSFRRCPRPITGDGVRTTPQDHGDRPGCHYRPPRIPPRGFRRQLIVADSIALSCTPCRTGSARRQQRDADPRRQLDANPRQRPLSRQDRRRLTPTDGDLTRPWHASSVARSAHSACGPPVGSVRDSPDHVGILERGCYVDEPA